MSVQSITLTTLLPARARAWARRRAADLPPPGAAAHTGRQSSMSDDRSPGADPRNDEELMLAYRDGEAHAFELLVVRHRRGLYNYVLRSVRNRARADELLQEIFLRVVRSRDRYQRTARFTTWVYTIARNLCVDESRRQRFRQTAPLEAKRKGRGGDPGLSVLDTTAARQVGTDDQAEGPRIRNRVQAAIDALPDDQREVFLMRQFGGLSFREIGETVGAPENTVKSRMRYALEKMRNELSDIDPREETAQAGKKGAGGG